MVSVLLSIMLLSTDSFEGMTKIFYRNMWFYKDILGSTKELTDENMLDLVMLRYMINVRLHDGGGQYVDSNLLYDICFGKPELGKIIKSRYSRE